MHVTHLLTAVALLLPALSLATSVFKYPQEDILTRPVVPQCPREFDENSPWFEDPDDCNCYYVCDMYGGMVKMCCPAGLWFDPESRNCHYVYTFTGAKQAECWGKLRGAGSTKQLREVFIGRCWDYQLFRNPSAFSKGYRDCNALFDTFLKTFLKKSACGEVQKEHYDELLSMAAHEIPESSCMMWSGTFSMAQDFSKLGKRLYTLESSLMGYILNDLQWCGMEADPGINYDVCPPFASCDGHAMASFWARASERYATAAQGVVTVMLNGSIPGRPAFRNNSFLARHEVPNFQVPQVHTLKIWVIQNLGAEPMERCHEGSVAVLERIATTKGLHVICEDNPAEVVALLCVDQYNMPECAKYSPLPQQPHLDSPSLVDQMMSDEPATQARYPRVEPKRNVYEPKQIQEVVKLPPPKRRIEPKGDNQVYTNAVDVSKNERRIPRLNRQRRPQSQTKI